MEKITHKAFRILSATGKIAAVAVMIMITMYGVGNKGPMKMNKVTAISKENRARGKFQHL